MTEASAFIHDVSPPHPMRQHRFRLPPGNRDFQPENRVEEAPPIPRRKRQVIGPNPAPRKTAVGGMLKFLNTAASTSINTNTRSIPAAVLMRSPIINRGVYFVRVKSPIRKPRASPIPNPNSAIAAKPSSSSKTANDVGSTRASFPKSVVTKDSHVTHELIPLRIFKG
jgi:hypothetical protein